MVDWDRVEEDRSKGWDWEKIAADPKVGFHPDKSVREPGRALRALYHRQRLRQRRQGEEPAAAVSKKTEERHERRWTLVRAGYLLTPLVGIWFLFAYFIPSPVGLVVAAVPYLALVLAVAAFLLLFGLWRTDKERWSKTFRSTLILGIVLGLVVSGLIALGGALFFGCPYLPSAASGTAEGGPGWVSYSASAWHSGGQPVMYFYGATWCPYCSASSWAIWKALTEFQSGFDGSTSGIPGTSFYYSNPGDVDPSTPEVVLGSASVSSPAVAFQASEYYWTLTNGATAGTFPGTSNCIQQAYVTAYSAGSIPFLVINGQYVHGGSSLIDPSLLSSYAGSGAGTVASSVLTESGNPWSIVQSQAGWICAFIIKSDGYSSVSAFLAANPGLNHPGNYQWTSGMTSLVNSDLSSIT